jgi:hypothetical protein
MEEELAGLLRERARLNERIEALRQEIAQEKCPFRPGMVLRRKGRGDWKVVEVLSSLTTDWAVRLAPVAAGGKEKGSILRTERDLAESKLSPKALTTQD